MAKRYSGRVRVSLRWDDAASAYRCGVTWTEPDGSRCCRRVTVNAPAHLTMSVDCPAAYDDAARAALAFVMRDAEGERRAGDGRHDYADPAPFVAWGAAGVVVERADPHAPKRPRKRVPQASGAGAAMIVLTAVLFAVATRV